MMPDAIEINRQFQGEHDLRQRDIECDGGRNQRERRHPGRRGRKLIVGFSATRNRAWGYHDRAVESRGYDTLFRSSHKAGDVGNALHIF